MNMNQAAEPERGGSGPANPFVRAFVEFPIPEFVKEAIERAQDELRRALPEKSVRWTKREQFHLTLRFLGNVEPSRLRDLSNALRGACSGFPALKLRAERVGCFPDLRFPRVVWAWVHDDAEQLPVLQSRIDAAVGSFAENREEKKFTGHVTVARTNGIKRSKAEVLAKQVSALTEQRFGEWVASEVKLMRSELLPSGAVHSVLAAFPLAGADAAQ
jgi:2'-5' RNA ligase